MYIIWEISTLLGFYSTPQMSLYVSNLIYYLVILFRSPFLIHQSKLGNVLMAVSEISCLGKWISFVVPLIAHSTYLNDILKVWPRELFFFSYSKENHTATSLWNSTLICVISGFQFLSVRTCVS